MPRIVDTISSSSARARTASHPPSVARRPERAGGRRPRRTRRGLTRRRLPSSRGLAHLPHRGHHVLHRDTGPARDWVGGKQSAARTACATSESRSTTNALSDCRLPPAAATRTAATSSGTSRRFILLIRTYVILVLPKCLLTWGYVEVDAAAFCLQHDDRHG